MQLDELDGYYNIDFEHELNVHDLRDFLIENFHKTNIVIDFEGETIEHFGNHGDNKFHISVSVAHLETDGVYDFEDIKTRVLLYIWTELQINSFDVMMLLQDFSKKINSKIYILMTDIEKVSFSFSYCSYWCIDNDKRRIVFDTEEFCDNPKSAYYECIYRVL